MRDVLHNRTVVLDGETVRGLLLGVLRGMGFLHARYVHGWALFLRADVYWG